MCHNLILFIGIQQSIFYFFSSDFVQWRLAFGDERLFKNLPDLISWTSFTKEIVHSEWRALDISEWNIFHSGIYSTEEYIAVNCFFCQLKVLDPCIAAGSASCYMRYSVFFLSCITYRTVSADGNYEQNISKRNFVFEALLWPNGLMFSSSFLNSPEEICLLDNKNTFVLVPTFFYLAIVAVFTPNRWFLAIFEVGIEPSCK